MASGGKGYIVKIGADISEVLRSVAAAKGSVQDIGKDKVLIHIDYEHGDINDIRDAIQKVADYDPKLRVQLQYDLESASLKQLLKEQEEDIQLLDLFKGQKVGKGSLDDYIFDVCSEIDDGLDEGLSKIDLSEKLKKLLDIRDSYTKYTGKYLSDMTEDMLFDLQQKLGLDDYEYDGNIFTGLSERVEKNKTIVKGLKLQLEDLKAKGAIDTEDIIDFTGASKAAEGINEVTSAIEKAEEAANTKGKIKFFDGIEEHIYDVKEDAEELEKILKNLADSWNEVQFRTGDEFVNTKNINDNLGQQLETGLNGATLGNGTYLSQNFKDIMTWKDLYSQSNLFATDTSKMEKMLRFASDDDFYNTFEALQAMHALIAKDIVPHENYDRILRTGESNAISSAKDLYDAYEQRFKDLSVSEESLERYINEQRTYLQNLNITERDKNGNLKISKDIYSKESFISKFFDEVIGVNGISVANLGSVDSSDFGSVIFKQLAKSLPYVDFGENSEWANKFAELTLSKILKNKANNPNVDLDEAFRTMTGVKTRLFETGDFNKMSESSYYSSDVLESLYSTLQEAKKIQAEATSITTAELNKSIFPSDSSIDDAISKYERLSQLQQTINNMKIDSSYGKSYEEIGQHIEKLNAQYEQTVAEIDKLRSIDDGSQEIKEQIGLLENLAVAYQNAMDASIPNDVAPGEWISKYTNIPRDKYFGIERDKLRQDADEFKAGLDQAILDTFRDAHSKNIKIGDGIISEETINTSALSEIPEIMERITSAGKEATQTMEQFGDAVSGKGNGIGDTSNEEVERLQSQLEEAQKEVENARAETRWAQESADTAWRDAYDSQEEASEARRQLLDVEKELRETREIVNEKDVEIGNLKEQLSNVQKASGEGSETKTEASSFKDVEGSATDAAAAKELFNEQNSELSGKVDASVSSLENEAAAFDLVTETALNAATAKELFVNQNIELAESAELSSEQLQKEAEYLEKIAQLTPNNQKEKSNKNQTNNKKDQSPEDLATKQATDLIARIKKLSSGSEDYLSGIWGLNDNPNNKSIISFLNEYDQEVSAVKSAVDALSQQWGEQNQKVREASSALNEYLNRMGVVTTTDLQKIAAQQIDKIDRAESVRRQQGSGFTDDYAEKLRSARDMAANILKELEGADFSKGFDKSKIIAWVQQLENGRQTLKEINDQENLLATKGSAEKLLGKINQDLSKGGLRGQLKKDYLELQSSVNKVVHSLDNVNLTPDGIEKSKTSLRELADQFQHLHTVMIETGQSAEGFSSKFATAINNQSAQFLATYFSFQDIIRYSKEIAQTVVGTDSALIELKKVSDASNERIQQSFTKSAETAQELGSTITSVINSTADWARLGYDVDQAEELARVTTLFQTVGDNMTQETASESLISTLKGFQLETSEAIDIVDKFNEVLAARSCRNANKDGMQLNLSKTNNTLKLLGHPKANLPNVSRKTEKSGWILYGEIKAFERMSYVV